MNSIQSIPYTHIFDVEKNKRPVHAVPCQIEAKKETKRENKIWAVVKKVFHAIGRWFHTLAGRLVVPASISFIHKKGLNDFRNRYLNTRNFQNYDGWQYKQIQVKVDNKFTVNAYLCKPGFVNNSYNEKRWTLVSNGNCQFAEMHLAPERYINSSKNLVDQFGSNLLVFDYPGVEESKGKVSRETLVKSYQAMLKLLEEGEKAEEIIGYGLSLGGGVQGEACEKHAFKEDVKYVFIKDRTFSEVSRVATPIASLFGWNMCAASSKKMSHPEIILQRANVKGELTKPNQVLDDGVISKKASLARAILKKGKRENQTIIGISQKHEEDLDFDTKRRLAEHVELILKKA